MFLANISIPPVISCVIILVIFASVLFPSDNDIKRVFYWQNASKSSNSFMRKLSVFMLPMSKLICKVKTCLSMSVFGFIAFAFIAAYILLVYSGIKYLVNL